MQKNNVVVIGAGIGGIAAAARLAQSGYRVTVIEKSKIPGGRCSYLEKDGHRFDTGPTLLLMPELYKQAFNDLGERIEDHLDLRRVDPTYHIHFKDGASLALTSDLNRMHAQLEAFEPGSFSAYLRYLDEGYFNYQKSIEHLVGRNFRSLTEFINLKNLMLVVRLKALQKHYNNIGNYFDDPRLKMAFTFQNLYMGINPFEAPAIFSLLQYSEFAHGVWFPMGGMYSIVEALAQIAVSSGVRFVYNTAVKRINIDERKATGVTLASGEQIPADIVVANADLPYVYRELLPDGRAARRLDRKKYGCSAIMFFWGLDKPYPQLGAHTLLMAEDYRRSMDPIFKDLALPADPSIYVHAPARLDPSMAPDEGDTITVALPVGHINTDAPQDWRAIRQRARQAALDYLRVIGIPDMGEHIKFEACYTPRYWQGKYHLTKGSAHGLSHDLFQMCYMRPHNRHDRYPNLYFVGAGTHPGSGVPTVLTSARLVTERILEDADLRVSVPFQQPILGSLNDTPLQEAASAD
jgi:phytoene desaturase